MNLLDRLLGHDAWTTRQLLMACQTLPDEALDRVFDIDHGSLRHTFAHLVDNMETWTDLMAGREPHDRSGESIAALLERLSVVGREFAQIARRVAAEGREDDCFWDTLDRPPVRKTFGGGIGHVLTHNMHHRAQIMFLMERLGLTNHIEGDLLTWESVSFGWR